MTKCFSWKYSDNIFLTDKIFDETFSDGNISTTIFWQHIHGEKYLTKENKMKIFRRNISDEDMSTNFWTKIFRRNISDGNIWRIIMSKIFDEMFLAKIFDEKIWRKYLTNNYDENISTKYLWRKYYRRNMYDENMYRRSTYDGSISTKYVWRKSFWRIISGENIVDRIFMTKIIDNVFTPPSSLPHRSRSL